MKTILKGLAALAVSGVMAVVLLPFASCKTVEEEPIKLSALKTQGELIVNEEGETVYLRGVNAGGLFVIEQWMTGFKNVQNEEGTLICRDHKTTTKAFIERFGEKKAQELWSEYQKNWWSEQDFQNCADMGMNVIRLPFTYMNVDFDAISSYDDAGIIYDFTALEDFVQTAAKYGMYTILDLHGAYGSQNGQDHSGEVISPAASVDFYSNEKMQTLTVNLWRELAYHFKDNPNVAAYDLLNEPGEKKDEGGTQSTSKRHWDFMDKAYKAVREEDENHIVVFESCWEGNNLPKPSVYGWENCMYSFHHYSGQTSNAEAHNRSMDNKISNVTAQKFGIPIQLGEFNCYSTEESWDYSLQTLNDNGWHWTSWTYKVNNSWGNSGWGIYYTEAKSVDPLYDQEEEILQKWKDIRTDEDTKKCTFESGRTLFEIMRKYCPGTVKGTDEKSSDKK